MKFIPIGFNNMIADTRVVALIPPDSAPAKRMVQDAKENGRVIDCTGGRKTRTVLVTDSEHIILSALNPETVSNRLNGADGEGEEAKNQ